MLFISTTIANSPTTCCVFRGYLLYRKKYVNTIRRRHKQRPGLRRKSPLTFCLPPAPTLNPLEKTQEGGPRIIILQAEINQPTLCGTRRVVALQPIFRCIASICIGQQCCDRSNRRFDFKHSFCWCSASAQDRHRQTTTEDLGGHRRPSGYAPTWVPTLLQPARDLR